MNRPTAQIIHVIVISCLLTQVSYKSAGIEVVNDKKELEALPFN